jgi:hypothetical protein
VNKSENEDVRGEYREFDPEDPNYEQGFAEDTDGGKSNLIPFAFILFLNTTCRS